MPNIDNEGTHGTTVTRFEQICKSGFQMSEGRVGKGIYCWSRGPYAQELATNWYRYRFANGRFNDDDNKKGMVLFVCATVGEREVIDFDIDYIAERIEKLAKKAKITNATAAKSMAAIYGAIVGEFEKVTGCSLKVFRMRMAPPGAPYDDTYPIKAVGAPRGFVVRDDKCIRITGQEEIP